MSLLEFKDVRFSYQEKELYRNLSFKLNEGEHAVIVGKNGVGKTTILKLAIGELLPDQGTISWENKVSYSYLNQQLVNDEKITCREYFHGVYEELFQKEKRMLELYQQGENDPKALEKAALLQEQLLESGFYALQEKIGTILQGIGFRDDLLDRRIMSLSGGQREKAMLAKMLLEEKDVLLLDEPTNFLDQAQVNWLENYLSDYPGAFLLISHDVGFLKKVANVVFLLENKILSRYKGDYDRFLTQKTLDDEHYQKEYEAQQRYIKKEELFIAKHIVRATSSRAAKSHRARLAHLERLEAPAPDHERLFFNFPFGHDVGEKPLRVEELLIGYTRPLLDPLSFELKKGEKIAIVGKNGIGKTTFLKTLLGIIKPLGGSYTFLPGLRIAYYEQEQKIDLSLSPFDFLRQKHPELTNTDLRNALGNVGIRKEMALRPLNALSGGEQSKTRFALMSLEKSDFLILDEPTNHLDQKSKEALFMAIERYPGSVILVSHEKDFYDGLTDYEIDF